MHKQFSSQDKKFLQPEYEVKIEDDLKTANALCYVTFGKIFVLNEISQWMAKQICDDKQKYSTVHCRN